jgi:enamine deaminase RidA (YjgF/YER057c/UK114 family)
MNRLNISSGTVWEASFGYARAVRIGNVIKVSGTVATDDNGAVIGAGDVYAQAVFIIAKIEKALNQAGATLEDVVRTRLYVTDIKGWEQLAKAHAEYFAGVRPATTLIEVQRLIAPEFLVEIEAEAIVPGEN